MRRIISPFLELARQVGSSCPDRPPVEPVPPRGDAFGQRLLGPAGQRHRLVGREGARVRDRAGLAREIEAALSRECFTILAAEIGRWAYDGRI